MNDQDRVEAWNAAYQDGTPVILTDDFQHEHATRTRSIAWMVSGLAVVKVEGLPGWYLLSRVRAATTDDAEPVSATPPPMTPAHAATLLQAACEWLRDKELDSLGAEHASNLRALADWAAGMGDKP